MTPFRIAIGALALVALSACSSPSRFGDDAYGGGNGAVTNQDIYGAGDASNPSSPAYFNQTVGDRVLFAVDQSTLGPEATAVLQGQAQWLMSNPEYSATIEGHADEQGTRVYNFNLGERRANAVKEFLVSRGVAPNRLTTISYGKERPLAICSEESCYTQNRRAVTVLAAGGLS